MSTQELARPEVFSSVGSGGLITQGVVDQCRSASTGRLLCYSAGLASIVLPLFALGSTGAAVTVRPSTPSKQLGAGEESTRSISATHYSLGAPPAERQLLEIKTLLQATVVDLARLLLVERPSVYQWLSGSQPRRKNQERIDILSDIATLWASLGLGPIRAYLARIVPDANCTLEDMLTAEKLQVSRVAAALRQFASSTESAAMEPRRMSVADRMAAKGLQKPSERTFNKQRTRFTRGTSWGED